LCLGGLPLPRFCSLVEAVVVADPLAERSLSIASRSSSSGDCSGGNEICAGASISEIGSFLGRPRPRWSPFSRAALSFSEGDWPIGYFRGRPRPRLSVVIVASSPELIVSMWVCGFGLFFLFYFASNEERWLSKD
jgi:hypothetical protein